MRILSCLSHELKATARFIIYSLSSLYRATHFMRIQRIVADGKTKGIKPKAG